MPRPASVWYWKSRNCYCSDAGGRRTVLVKGDRTRANRQVALKRLVELLDTLPATSVPRRCHTVAELVDVYLANSRCRVAAGEIKGNTLELYYRPNGVLLRKEIGD